MEIGDGETRGRPVVAIAQAPAPGVDPANLGACGASLRPTMPYTCQACARRKVKCDKATPTCSACRRGRLECVYQAPLPRSRKRRLSADVLEKLARYEGILREHGLLDAVASAPAVEGPPKEPISLHWNGPEPIGTGKLVAGQGGSTYIDSSLWQSLGSVKINPASDDEDEGGVEDGDPVAFGVSGSFASDPLTCAFMGFQQGLLHYHPTPAESMMLWETHVENVEPLCKILHVPTTARMVQAVSQQPATASKADECVLFAIYLFAIFSMAEEECLEKLGQDRSTLMQQYHFAARQALVNASFLKTTELPVLQALVLFLTVCRGFYEAHTYWILTGVAIRIAQRMGLQRDGEKLGLPPFEVQMRRRLFWQLVPLDAKASQMSGVVASIMPDDWDALRPLNVNDDQIWPGMTEPPEAQVGATEMIFYLSRSRVGGFFAKAVGEGGPTGRGSWQFNNYHAAERVINDAEGVVEEKYIRYCDVVNPLHFMTIILARSGITAMRLRIRLPKVKSHTATDAEILEAFQLAQKIIDADTTACVHPSLRIYRWYVKPFFLWGMWDSLILVLTCLWKRSDVLPYGEIRAAWQGLEQVYLHHDELTKSKWALYVALRRLALEAWAAHPRGRDEPEPAFIATLRSLRRDNTDASSSSIDSFEAKASTGPTSVQSKQSDADAPLPSTGCMSLDSGDELALDAVDWVFWDQLIRDPQAQGGRSLDGIS